MKEKIFNQAGNKYITQGIGPHCEHRFEVWVARWNYWCLEYWNTDKAQAMEYWECTKDEPIKVYCLLFDTGDEGGIQFV